MGISMLSWPTQTQSGGTDMLHYTNKPGWNAIRSQVDWTFKIHPPPTDHPEAAYFTTLEPNTVNLANRLRIPKEKIEYVFCFEDAEDLLPIEGDRGAYVFYSPSNYIVVQSRQNDHGRRDEGTCQ